MYGNKACIATILQPAIFMPIILNDSRPYILVRNEEVEGSSPFRSTSLSINKIGPIINALLDAGKCGPSHRLGTFRHLWDETLQPDCNQIPAPDIRQRRHPPLSCNRLQPDPADTGHPATWFEASGAL